MTKQTILGALLVICSLVAYSGHLAYATDGTQSLVTSSPDGTMVKSKHQDKNIVTSATTTGSGSASWTDCNGNAKSATANISVSAGQTYVYFKWSWPSSTYTGITPLCVNSSFGALQHTITDVNQGWTVYSTPFDTAYSQPNWQKYDLKDSHGFPLTTNLNDILHVKTTACYGGNGYVCTWTKDATYNPVIVI